MNILRLINGFMLKCARVWRVTKKPNLKEFKTIAKVSAIGVLAIGFIGFVVSLIIKIFLK